MDCLGRGCGEKTVSTVRSVAKRVAQKIAKKVSKNNLFEQEGERKKQEPLHLDKTTVENDVKEQVIPSSNSAIEERLLGVRVVNYWATWCAPCVEELPLLVELQELIGADKILGVSWDLFQGGELSKVCSDVERMKERFGIEYPSMLVVEPPEQFFAHFEVEPQTVPQTIVFSENFEKIYHCTEALKKKDLDDIIRLLQEEKK